MNSGRLIIIRTVIQIASLLLIYSHVSASGVIFMKGDASFPAYVIPDSDFLSGGTSLAGINGFRTGTLLDGPIGWELSVDAVPREQLEAVRSVIRKELAMIPNPRERMLFVFVCDSDFDCQHNWLGLPYNSDTAISRFDVPANTFGPPGAAAISVRDSIMVPPLKVRELSNNRYAVSGHVKFCIIPFKDAILQRSRTVCSSDGSIEVIQFVYEPRYRVCFAEGDSFFVAKASHLLSNRKEIVELEYAVNARTQYFVWFDAPQQMEDKLSDHEIRFCTQQLPIRKRGHRLKIHGFPNDIQRYVESKSDLPWYIFVVEKDFDVQKYQLGVRYNSIATSDPATDGEIEYVDFNVPWKSYPQGLRRTEFPKALPVTNKGGDAVVNFSECKVVLFQYHDNFPFYPDLIESCFYVIKGSVLESWSNGSIVSTVAMSSLKE